jgi:hypothetical protein
MATLPQYKYGKVSGTAVTLTVVSERGESPMVCCGWCSAQMACITAAAGVSNRMFDEAHAMRAAGGRPHNAGNKASELRVGASKAVGVTLRDVKVADIPQRLKDGFAVTVGLQYKDLPAWLKVQTNDFGHAACLYGWSEGKVGYFDPIWSQGVSGAWAPWDNIRDAMWGDGNHSTTVEQRSSGGAYDMGIYYNPARWKATKDMEVFTAPDWKDKVTEIKKGTTFTSLGPKAVTDPDGHDKSARAVLVQTGGLIPGTADPTHKAILWAKGADFPPDSIPTSGDWDESIWRLAQNPDGRYPCPDEPTPPTPGPVDCFDALALRDVEWERALRRGEKWPTEL